jgi:hypothetical protein
MHRAATWQLDAAEPAAGARRSGQSGCARQPAPRHIGKPFGGRALCPAAPRMRAALPRLRQRGGHSVAIDRRADDLASSSTS